MFEGVMSYQQFWQYWPYEGIPSQRTSSVDIFDILAMNICSQFNFNRRYLQVNGMLLCLYNIKLYQDARKDRNALTMPSVRSVEIYVNGLLHNIL